MAQPLTGYRVIDHGEFITAPYTAMLLGDLGAEVIKVERPGGGDRFRSFEKGLYGPQFQAFNRSKQSIVLDLETEADRDTLRALLRSADVYVQNFRPGASRAPGLRAGRRSRDRPARRVLLDQRLRPRRTVREAARLRHGRPGALGFLSMFVSPRGSRESSGPRRPIRSPACTRRAASSPRCWNASARVAPGAVHVPMVAAMAHFSIEQYHRHFVTGDVPDPSDRGRVSQSFAFRCADGRLIAIHLSSPVKFWTAFVAAIERPDLATDARFAGRMDRVRNHEALEAALRPVFASRSAGRMASAAFGAPTCRTRRSSAWTKRSTIRRCATSQWIARSRIRPKARSARCARRSFSTASATMPA